ncbi:MAG: hypothetical protein HN742_34515 [Lentisphaerae bacterium]|jgi:hypothetical protein|nr:hypothetical protein [Lentisphaerota bacterium]MBT4819873.1 hypothetical protein [Lentisphaerota bacterium]MBT5605073.1 hypothetical protein [Lentisphaerota bacterium]MBT7062242.1 hypothetical protein [Lentisphaerota bacterium]MBT7847036.1 hypothetical protein [Lentisphaerota bacterium]
MKRRARATAIALIGLTSLLGTLRAQPSTLVHDYSAIVTRAVETLMAKGTDRYGRVHSPLFAACLDLRTLAMPTHSPRIPPGPRIREGDRCWPGCNLYLDTLTIRVMYDLTRRTGDPKYRQAAEDYMAYVLKYCPSPTTGLLPWGEHTFWNLTTDSVERDRHELLVWQPLWPELWDINAPAVRRAIEGGYAHHVFDKTTGLFDRHASYGKARAVLNKTQGMPWIKHAGLIAYSLAFLYGQTGEQLYLDRALQMANLYWNTRDDKTGLPIGCIGYSEQPGSGGISQTVSLLAASQASGRREFRDMAVAYLEAFLKRRSFKGAASVPETAWAIGYGSDGGIFRECQYVLQGYQATGSSDMLAFCEYWGRGMMAGLPPEQATAEAYGRSIRFLAGLSRATGNAVYVTRAHRLAELAMQRLYHQPSGLFRGMVGYDYYDAQFGIGELFMGLLALDDRARLPSDALLKVEILTPGVASGIEGWPLRIAVSNAGDALVNGTIRLKGPSSWRVTPSVCPFEVVASESAGDAWIRESGITHCDFTVTSPSVAETQTQQVVLSVETGKEGPHQGRDIALSLMTFGARDVLAEPFVPDDFTIAIAHLDSVTAPDHLKGASWSPEDVGIVSGGVFAGAGTFTRDTSRIRLAFPGGVPPNGTLEFFFRPAWSSTPGREPASDDVQRHIFNWAPMTRNAMLWGYFLDELGAYMGLRVHGKHGKPGVRLDLPFDQGRWHHLAMCWETTPDGALRLAYFVDGRRCNKGDLARRPLPAGIHFGNELNIGSYPNCPANGIIDEIRVSSVRRYTEGLIIPALEGR